MQYLNIDLVTAAKCRKKKSPSVCRKFQAHNLHNGNTEVKLFFFLNLLITTGINFITVKISIKFYCCLLIVLLVSILPDLACNFGPKESMNGQLGKINLYPPRGSSAAQKLWPCCGAPCSSWLQP